MIGLETHPIRSKSITNHDWLARVFPRFVPATCNYVNFDWFTGQGCLYLFWLLRVIQKESSTSSLTSGKTALYHDCLHWNFCATLWILSQKITFFNNTKRWKQILKFISTHLKVLVKWNRWWNFPCACTISLNFEICFLEFPWETFFEDISGNCLYL